MTSRTSADDVTNVMDDLADVCTSIYIWALCQFIIIWTALETPPVLTYLKCSWDTTHQCSWDSTHPNLYELLLRHHPSLLTWTALETPSSYINFGRDTTHPIQMALDALPILYEFCWDTTHPYLYELLLRHHPILFHMKCTWDTPRLTYMNYSWDPPPPYIH